MVSNGNSSIPVQWTIPTQPERFVVWVHVYLHELAAKRAVVRLYLLSFYHRTNGMSLTNLGRRLRIFVTSCIVQRLPSSTSRLRARVWIYHPHFIERDFHAWNNLASRSSR